MADTSLATRLIETLPAGLPGLFNPWQDHCPHDADSNGPAEKRERLARHLDCDPALILVGEAPGYQGCRYSGIAFTSERLLIEGVIPRIAALPHRLSTRRLPFSEPSATIVWKTLFRLGIAERTILWNALQLHPHRPGDPWSNRTPTADELLLGASALQFLIASFPCSRIVAVGRKAEQLMMAMNVTPAATVRHPANGGATAFAAGIEVLM
ncbi:MAG: uracil-DNA glycosylase [Desulfuromonadales bacterium]|nr:uracil-DNA glycosylase [Desulfuromonadales bacterium]